MPAIQNHKRILYNKIVILSS